MLRTMRAVLVVGTALCLLVLVGCGGKKPVTVKGTIELPKTLNVKLAEQDVIKVGFEPETKGQEGVGATASATSRSFTAQVPPGKYKISVSITPYPGSEGSEKRKEQLSMLNRAFSPSNTKMTYDVTADHEQTITIDLSTGTVKK